MNDSEFLATHGSPPVHYDNDHLESEVGGKFYLSPDINPFHTLIRAQTKHDMVHRKFSSVRMHKNLIAGLLNHRSNSDATGKKLVRKLPSDFIKKMFNYLLIQTFLGFITCLTIKVVSWESRRGLQLDQRHFSESRWTV